MNNYIYIYIYIYVIYCIAAANFANASHMYRMGPLADDLGPSAPRTVADAVTLDGRKHRPAWALFLKDGTAAVSIRGTDVEQPLGGWSTLRRSQYIVVDPDVIWFQGFLL